MKTRILGLLTVLTLVVVSSVAAVKAANPPAQTPTTYSIYGQVFNKDTMARIAGAKIKTNLITQVATSDNVGYYRITIPVDQKGREIKMTFSVTANGYNAFNLTMKIKGDTTLNFPLTPQKEYANYRVIGRVLDKTNMKAIAGAAITTNQTTTKIFYSEANGSYVVTIPVYELGREVTVTFNVRKEGYKPLKMTLKIKTDVPTLNFML